MFQHPNVIPEWVRTSASPSIPPMKSVKAATLEYEADWDGVGRIDPEYRQD